jgi:hypothetical protein
MAQQASHLQRRVALDGKALCNGLVLGCIKLRPLRSSYCSFAYKGSCHAFHLHTNASACMRTFASTMGSGSFASSRAARSYFGARDLQCPHL